MTETTASYLDKLLSLLGLLGETRRENASPTPTSEPVRCRQRPKRQRRRSATARRRSFDDGLRTLASRQSPHTAGAASKFHLINIDKIRERLGDRWGRLCESVHRYIEAELVDRLGPRDFYHRQDDSTYIIMFDDCTEREARLRMVALSESILQKLLGEDHGKDLELLGLRSLVANADQGVVANAINGIQSIDDYLENSEHDLPGSHAYTAAAGQGLTAAAISSLLTDVEAHVEALAERSKKGEAGGSDEGRVHELIEPLGRLARTLADALAKDGAGRTEGAAHGTGTPDADRADALARLRDLEQRALGIIQQSEQVPEPAAEGPEPFSWDIRYLPMWAVVMQRVATYHCQVVFSDSTDDFGCQLERRREIDPVSRASMTLATLARVFEDLQLSASNGVSNAIVLPIDFGSLRRRDFAEHYFSLCAEIPSEMKKLLIWELVHVPMNNLADFLPMAVALLRQSGRVVLVRLGREQVARPSLPEDFKAVAEAGVRSAGLDISEFEGSEAEKLTHLDDFAVAALDAGLDCFAHGFDTVSLTVSASCMGYQHLTGPAIGGPTGKPSGIQPTRLEAVYGRTLGGSVEGDAVSPETAW